MDRLIWVVMFSAIYGSLAVAEPGKGILATPSKLLKFTSTQKWLPHFWDLAKQREKQGPLLTVAPPPPNDSEVTKKELSILAQLQAKRTTEMNTQILVEKDVNNISYGEIAVDDHEQLFTPIGQLVYSFLFQSMGELFAQKKKFDRVRPVFLSQASSGSLRTLIETPFHPAYPSGHSFQGHGVALLIAQIAPDQAEAALCDATRLAVGREIAGVHYPSDSHAGAELARVYLSQWLKRPQVKMQVAAAAKWWKEHREEFLAERAFRKRSLYIDLKPPCSLEGTRRAILDNH